MSQDSLFTVDQFKKMKGPKGKKKFHEEKVQIQVCEYLKTAYPDVIFTCDLASGMNLPLHIAAKNKKMRSNRGFPDLFIACPKASDLFEEGASYYGLFIELKKEGIRLKNGSMPNTDHIREQQQILDHLTKLGYKAVFGVGFNECKEIIDNYLK